MQLIARSRLLDDYHSFLVVYLKSTSQFTIVAIAFFFL